MLFRLLLDRSQADPGAELFLRNVFLYLGLAGQLKNCRTVCKEWNNFIQAKIWGVKSVKQCLEARLNYNWRNGNARRRRISWEVGGRVKLSDLICDDRSALVSGKRGMEACLLYLVDLDTDSRTTLLDIPLANNGDSELKISLGPAMLVAALSYENWLWVWSRSGRQIARLPISEETHYIRLVKVLQSQVFVVDTGGATNRICVFRLESASNRFAKVREVRVPPELGTTRAVASTGGWPVYSGHDREVVVWQEDSAALASRLNTGLVVDMALHNGLLLTVGSSQRPGLSVWCPTSGTRLLYVLPVAALDRLAVAGNQVLVAGGRTQYSLQLDYMTMQCTRHGTALTGGYLSSGYICSHIALTTEIHLETALVKKDSDEVTQNSTPGNGNRRVSTIVVNSFWT